MARRRPSIHRAAALVTVAVLAGFAQPACIFFVPDDNHLQTSACSFTGSTTPCGLCVTSKCPSELDTCCTTGSCKGDLSYLDQCAGQNDQTACQTLFEDLAFDDTSGAFRALGQCMNQCTACGGDGGAPFLGTGSGSGTSPPPGMGVTCSDQGDYCSCTTGGSSNSGPTCDDTYQGSSVCCTTGDYPTAGTCTCSPYQCQTDNEGDCSCSAMGLESGGNPTDSCDANGGVCCANNEGVCSCFASISQCSGSSVEVDSCTTPPSDVNICGDGITLPSCSTQ